MNRIREEDLDKEDISHRRALRAAYRLEEIMDSICSILIYPWMSYWGIRIRDIET